MGKQVQFAGLLVWHEDSSGTGNFLFHDHLGSIRVTGSASGTLADDNDYQSFGTLFNNYGASPSDNHYLFTGYESDSDTTTDHATFRNLGLTYGRFNRPDPYDGSYDLTNPQSLNRYSYALNNPLSLIDPTGLEKACYWGAAEDEGWDDAPEDGGATKDECDSQGGEWTEIPGPANWQIVSGDDPLSFCDLDPTLCFNPNSAPSSGLAPNNPAAPNNPNCSGSNAQVVANASIAALSHLNPTQDETNNITPRDGNFANVVNPALINTNTWTNAASAHGSSLQSPTIPGQNIFVVKLYNDPNRGNIIAVVYPNGTLAHMQGLIPFLAGSTSVNVPAARAYLGCPAH